MSSKNKLYLLPHPSLQNILMPMPVQWLTQMCTEQPLATRQNTLKLNTNFVVLNPEGLALGAIVRDWNGEVVAMSFK
ncbi:hypothetical protein Tsubulata_002662, partial [Turnera subulata]